MLWTQAQSAHRSWREVYKERADEQKPPRVFDFILNLPWLFVLPVQLFLHQHMRVTVV